MKADCSSLLPAYTEMDDAALLQAITAGQSAALAALYDRYGRLVYSLAMNVLSEPAAAEEVTQDVFVQVWDKASRYDGQLGKVSSWLIGIARNRSIDGLRRRNARPEGHQMLWEDGLSTDDPPVESQVETAERKGRIRQAMARLPQEQRDALALAFFYGYTHQEIAAARGEPLGTVKTRIRLAMQKLRQELGAIK